MGMSSEIPDSQKEKEREKRKFSLQKGKRKNQRLRQISEKDF